MRTIATVTVELWPGTSERTAREVIEHAFRRTLEVCDVTVDAVQEGEPSDEELRAARLIP